VHVQLDIVDRHPEQYRMKLVPVAAPHEAPFLQHYKDLDPDRRGPSSRLSIASRPDDHFSNSSKSAGDDAALVDLLGLVPRRYYVKMDDDIVWLADGAIEAMLEEKLRGRFLYLSANIVNHSSLGLVRRQTACFPLQCHYPCRNLRYVLPQTPMRCAGPA